MSPAYTPPTHTQGLSEPDKLACKQPHRKRIQMWTTIYCSNHKAFYSHNFNLILILNMCRGNCRCAQFCELCGKRHRWEITPLHCTVLCCAVLRCYTLNSIICTSLHYVTFKCTALYSTVRHTTALHYTALPSATLNSHWYTALHLDVQSAT